MDHLDIYNFICGPYNSLNLRIIQLWIYWISNPPVALLSGPDQVIFCALYAQGLDILQCCNTEIVENSDTSQMFILFVVVLFCTECTFSHCKCLEKIAANVVINIVGHHCSTGTLCLCTPCLPVCEQSFQNIYHIASGDMISLTTAKRRYADYSLRMILFP